MQNVDRRMYIIVKPNSFAYNPARINVGSLGYYEGTKDVIVSSLYEVFQTTNAVSDLFLKQWFKTDIFTKWIEQLQEGSVRLYFYYDKLRECKMCIPSITEQKKIAKFMILLEKRIEKQRQLVEALKSYKRGVLSKLFPQKGETTPRYHFAGFTEPWKQRKLSELGSIVTGTTPPTAIPEYYSEDGIPWVTPTDITENVTTNTERKLSPLGQQVGRIVPANTILVTCIASIGKNTMLGTIGSFNQQINGLTPDENKYDPYFLLTESALWSIQMKRIAAAGTMQIVNRTEFSEMETWIPEREEQQTIGGFFRLIDHLITIYQQKFDVLQRVKSALLQQLFM